MTTRKTPPWLLDWRWWSLIVGWSGLGCLVLLVFVDVWDFWTYMAVVFGVSAGQILHYDWITDRRRR